MPELDYTVFERLLADSHALTDVPEAHGTLAGSLCAGGDFGFEDWMREIYPEGRPSEEARGPLLALFEGTRHALGAGEMTFVALLPGDEAPISARASALGQWCQGFLYGLGSQALPDAAALPEQVGEIVRDLTSITQVGVDDSESEESNEQAYSELVEFVRVGAQLLYEELARFRKAPSVGPGEGPSLH